MRHFYLYILLCIAFPGRLHSEPPIQLSPYAKAYLLTCAPGEEVYSHFGHSALRIRDPQLDIDFVYNYGTFEFGPGFVMKFARGKLLYYLSRGNYNLFLATYYKENRAVTQQQIELQPEDIQRLFNVLEENYKPENRSYFYDFFFDNCSSRIRDILKKALGERLNFRKPEKYKKTSFRGLFNVYLDDTPWMRFGINLLLGMPADKKASHLDAMYLPDHLMEGFAHATLDDMPLVVNTKKVIALPPYPFSEPSRLFSPEVIFWIFFGLFVGLTLWERKKMKYFLWVDRSLFLISGLLGIFLLLMWLATDHGATKWNPNVLWANPLYLIFIWKNKLPLHKITKSFFKYVVPSLIGVYFLLALITMQTYVWIFLPIILTLLVRSLSMVFSNTEEEAISTEIF